MDRKEPSSKIRIAKSICAALEKKAARERYRGSFNGYAEGLLDQIAEDLYVPEGTAKIDRVIDLLEEILDLVKRPGGERIKVQGHRPAKEYDERRKAS